MLSTLQSPIIIYVFHSDLENPSHCIKTDSHITKNGFIFLLWWDLVLNYFHKTFNLKEILLSRANTNRYIMRHINGDLLYFSLKIVYTTLENLLFPKLFSGRIIPCLELRGLKWLRYELWRELVVHTKNYWAKTLRTNML